MSSVLRSTTFQIHVKNDDGTVKIKQFTRAVQDADKVTEELNRTLGDNVTATYKTEKSTTELTRQARLQVTQFERSERKIKEMAAAYELQSAMVGKTKLQQEQLNAVYRLGEGATEAQKQQIMSLVAANHQLDAAQNTQQGSMINARGVMQNFGWQMQDTLVQLQMGTSGFIILSQQGSQMASAFGPGGAVLGALIALGGMVGMVAYELYNTKVSTEQLEAAQESLNLVMKESGTSVVSLTDDFRELIEADKDLAQLQMTKALGDAEVIIKANREKIRDLSDEYLNLDKSVTGVIFKSGEMYSDEAQTKLGLTSTQWYDLSRAIQDSSYWGGESTEKMKSMMVELLKSSSATPELKKLMYSIADVASETQLAEEQIKRMAALLKGDLADSASKATEELDKLTDSFTDKYLVLGMTKRQQDLYNASVKYGSEVSGEELQAGLDAINMYHDQKDSLDDAAQAEKDRIKAAKDAAREMKRMAAQAARDKKAAKREEDRQKKADARDDIEGFKEMDRLRQQEVERFASSVGDMRHSLDASRKIEQQFLQQKNDIEKAYAEGYISMEQATVLSLANQYTYQGELFSLYATGIGNAANYLLSMADTMLNGADQAKTATEDMNGFQKTLWLASQAGLAAKALMDGISLGMSLAALFPIAAPVMITAGTTLGSVNAGLIMGTSFAGAFDDGGYIPSNSMGIVSEYGDELVNGQLIKGPARVTSREDTAKLMNGNGGITINVIEGPGVAVTQRQIDEKTVEIIAKAVFDKNIDKGVSGVLRNPKSSGAKAIQSTTKAGRKL
jgi:hypothetical protein